VTEKRVYHYLGTSSDSCSALASLLIADLAIGQSNYSDQADKTGNGREPGGNTDIGYRPCC